MEHLHHFGLKQDAFGNEPDLRFYMDSAYHTDARRRVERGLRQAKGLSVLTGDPGTGKTLLARRLFEDLEEEVFEANLMVMLPGAVEADVVIARFARQLGVEEPGRERSALLAQIYEQLAIVREEGRSSVLIIDDAHLLGRRAMAEIGGLLNLEYEERHLLSLLLVGLPELDQVLSGDSSLHQRVDVRVRLAALDLEGTRAYVAHRLALVGGSLEIFPDATVEVIAKFSRGRPRLINTLADNALFEAFLGGRSQVEAADVERSAGDLGIGPDPGTTYRQPMPATATAAVVPIGPEAEAGGMPAAASAAAPEAVPNAPVAEPAGGAEDLGSLLDSAVGPADELTSVLDGDSPQAAATIDLDAEMEAILVQSEQAPEAPSLPAFEAENGAEAVRAEATRIAFPEEDPSAQDAGEGEIDDLFVQLIDD